MALTIQTAAIRARQIITEQSEGAVNVALPRIQALIPTALETWVRMCLESREKRELFKRLIIADVTDDQVELEEYIFNDRINLKELRETTIYSVSEGTAYTWVNSKTQLEHSRPFGSDAPACYLEGNILYVRGAGDTESEAEDADEEIQFTVTCFPDVVGDIPPTLEQDFVRFLAMTAIGGEQGKAK